MLKKKEKDEISHINSNEKQKNEVFHIIQSKSEDIIKMKSPYNRWNTKWNKIKCQGLSVNSSRLKGWTVKTEIFLVIKTTYIGLLPSI